MFRRHRSAVEGGQPGAPEVVLIYESGPIGAKPSVLPLSIGDGELAETADTVVPTAEIFRYWLQGGRIDVGFLGAAQIDRFGNINTTVIGPYATPKVRLPGASPQAIITDLCVLKPESDSNEFIATALHPGVTREQAIAATGWPLRFGETVVVSPAPPLIELAALRDLEARTAAAHGQTGIEE